MQGAGPLVQLCRDNKTPVALVRRAALAGIVGTNSGKSPHRKLVVQTCQMVMDTWEKLDKPADSQAVSLDQLSNSPLLEPMMLSQDKKCETLGCNRAQYFDITTGKYGQHCSRGHRDQAGEHELKKQKLAQDHQLAMEKAKADTEHAATQKQMIAFMVQMAPANSARNSMSPPDGSSSVKRTSPHRT